MSSRGRRLGYGSANTLQSMEAAQFSGAYERYLHLDPRVSDQTTAQTLSSVVPTLTDTSRKLPHHLLAASAALELAELKGADTDEGGRLLDRARDRLRLITWATEDSKDRLAYVDEAVRADWLGVVLGKFEDPETKRAERQTPTDRHASILEELIGYYQDVPDLSIRRMRPIMGLAMEQTLLCLLDDPVMEDQGIYVAPSYVRQAYARTHVDDLAYRWNLTVYSNGKTIDRGSHRIQAMLGGGHGVVHNTYHPEIAVVNAAVDLGDNPYLEQRFVAAHQILAGDVAAIEAHRERLLTKLSKREPIAG